MKYKFSIQKYESDYATGIKYGKKLVCHLQPATLINEHYIKWLRDVLNGKNIEPPEPLYFQKKNK